MVHTTACATAVKTQGWRAVVKTGIPVRDHQRALLKSILTEGAGGDKMQQQPFSVVSFNTISKVFQSLLLFKHDQVIAGRFPFPTSSLTGLQITQRRNNWVTTVLPWFSLVLKLHWKTPKKHLGDSNTSVIVPVLNIRIYLGCYKQVFSWKCCCIPTLPTVLDDHLIQTSQPTCRSRGQLFYPLLTHQHPSH